MVTGEVKQQDSRNRTRYFPLIYNEIYLTQNENTATEAVRYSLYGYVGMAG